ncbi:hypothetical protein [Rhodopseudomonas palustris]|uniref:hypothetical protein n=1 Tax=Rhodopseudomonas palustris TaxID=1076 RepID=UPI000641D36B|nr:hypothetical protein [Rhodopseudomonas palustris]
MPQDNTPVRGYALPHPDNIARDDAARIRAAIQAIDADVAAALTEAAEDEAGRVRLATEAEAATGTANDAVLTVKRTKDMIVALLAVLEDAVGGLASQTTADKAAIEGEIDALSDAVTTGLAARVLVAGGQTLSGGFDTTGLETVMAGGTFTPAPKSATIQNVVNRGAHSIAPPATICTVVVQYWNDTAAGALTASGFTKVTGATFSSASGAGHVLFVTKTKDYSHLHIVAMQ